jgi:hypothetical protein
MKCILVIIGAVTINPCTIASTEPYKDHKCIVWHNSGDAWSGQHRTILPYSCDFVRTQIQQQAGEK